MADLRRDPREPIDAAINTPGREGLTGTAPANLYAPSLDREQITIAPDFAPPEAQPAWRQDFPIDWPQDLYVERRDFMKFMVLTSAAFTLGQLWIGAQNWYRQRGGSRPSSASRRSTTSPSAVRWTSPIPTNTNRACSSA